MAIGIIILLEKKYILLLFSFFLSFKNMFFSSSFLKKGHNRETEPGPNFGQRKALNQS